MLILSIVFVRLFVGVLFGPEVGMFIFVSAAMHAYVSA